MSALGQKRTSRDVRSTSALLPIATKSAKSGHDGRDKRLCVNEAVTPSQAASLRERAHNARDDRNLVHRIDARKARGDQRVPHLVIGDAVAFLLAQNGSSFPAPPRGARLPW